MIRVEVSNVVTSREYVGSFDSMEEAESWIEQMISKGSWGKSERIMHEDDMSEIEKQRVTTKEKNEEGKWICNVMKDYEIVIYQDSIYKQKRASEYPSWEDVMEALIENMEMRPEKLNLIKQAREIIRNKYPKDSKELLERR